MLKKIATLCLIFSLLFTLSPAEPAYAAISSMAAPENVTVKVEGTRFIVNWQNPASVTEFAKSCYDNYDGNVYFLVDWRVNGGSWHYDSQIPDGVDVYYYFPNLNDQFINMLIRSNDIELSQTAIDKPRLGIPYHISINEWLKENKIEFRVHYVYSYWGQGSEVSELSEFSTPATLGVQNPSRSGNPDPLVDENGLLYPPSSLGMAQDLTVIERDENIFLRWKQPEDVKTLSDTGWMVRAVIDYKINDGDWHDGYRGFWEVQYVNLLRSCSSLFPNEDGYVEEEIYRHILGVTPGRRLSVWLSDKTIYFRVRFVLNYFDNNNKYREITSPYSKTVAIGRDAKNYQSPKTMYQNASSWAIPELDRAAQYGFITSSISARMNAPITREELCEVIMKMYERLEGKVDVIDEYDTFSDTKNSYILQAYKLGIVNGIGNGKFAPKELTNREQVAAMMHRAIQAMNTETDFSTIGAENFADENLISTWALESVKFMNKNGIIKGNKGYVDPKGTTTREQAVLIVLRTYEQFGY